MQNGPKVLDKSFLSIVIRIHQFFSKLGQLVKLINIGHDWDVSLFQLLEFQNFIIVDVLEHKHLVKFPSKRSPSYRMRNCTIFFSDSLPLSVCNTPEHIGSN